MPGNLLQKEAYLIAIAGTIPKLIKSTSKTFKIIQFLNFAWGNFKWFQ